MFDCFLYNKETNRKKVLITGFGPFSEIETNPSWEGVKFMNKKEIENKYDIVLSRKEIPVRYEDVDLIVPRSWDSFGPDLTIHVGVSEIASCFTLETQANKYGYKYPDVDGKYAECNQNKSSGPNTIATDLDVECICDEFNRCPPGDGLQADVSHSAGLYLCEYIYYTSLCRGTTLFVHVPLDKYTSEQIAQGLERILELCLLQLSEDHCTYCYNIRYIVPFCFERQTKC